MNAIIYSKSIRNGDRAKGVSRDLRKVSPVASLNVSVPAKLAWVAFFPTAETARHAASRSVVAPSEDATTVSSKVIRRTMRRIWNIFDYYVSIGPFAVATRV